jgi:hypothetical protein
MRTRAVVFVVVCSVVPARAGATDDPAALRRRIEALERELAEERERFARERQAQDERLRALESRLEELSERAVSAAPPPPTFPGILNPALSVIANVLFSGSDRKTFSPEGERTDNRANLRETEIDLRAAVDPFADAVTILAVESQRPGEFEAGIEEGYVRLKRLPFLETPPLGAKFKFGRFRPSFGRINLLHTHDLPQSFRPLVIEEFLGEEGFVGDGISLQGFLPTPFDEESSLDFTVEVTAGDLAAAPRGRSDASLLGHLRWFRPFGSASSLEAGSSGLYSRSDSPLRESWLGGFDVLYKWQPPRRGQSRSFLLGAEYFAADRESGSEEPGAAGLRGRTRPQGAYGFAQVQAAPRWYLGVRGDWTETVEDPSIRRRGITPYVSVYASEFLRFRLNYEHLWSDRPDEDRRNRVLLEANAVFGSHPPEPFWVNK